MAISIEFFPPKDAVGEERLWEAMTALYPLAPDFISVTYGAGGSTRDRTIRITKEIQERTGIDTVAHLTCVGSTRSELIEILNQYKQVGIKSILALRGDPSDGPAAKWIKTQDGFDHADQLVELASKIGDFEIGVAAFPDGHPASLGNLEQDIEVLIRKEELGATFATTQFFFETHKWESLVEKLKTKGSKLKVIPGILPISNVRQLKRMAELGGTPIPAKIESAFEAISDDSEAVRKLGVELATNLSSELLAAGASGLHFYTMNSSASTLEIVKNLKLDAHEA